VNVELGGIEPSSRSLKKRIPRGIMNVEPGRYRHYKGNEYTVIGVALHSESQEELVVYRQEYGEHGLWVRPKLMFLETVEFNSQQVPRFQRVADLGDSR